MSTLKKSVKSVSLKYRHLKMEHVNMMSNTHFLFILYKLQVMKVYLSTSEHFEIIASAVILNPNILRECLPFFLNIVIIADFPFKIKTELFKLADQGLRLCVLTGNINVSLQL